MPKPQKTAEKYRNNLYLDADLGDWIKKSAEKLGLSDTAFIRMILIEARKPLKQEK